jgi:hypothetical protein
VTAAKFTRTTDSSSRAVTNTDSYTTSAMAEPFHWRGEKPTRRGSQMAPAKAPIGNQDIGRVADFMQGVRESRDQRAKTAAVMVGAYVGVRALQHWSAWKRQQGR